jgi:TonB-dependent receptor
MGLFSLLGSTSLYSANITGTVYDAENAYYVEGVQVSIGEDTRPVYTTKGGRFTIIDVDPGIYTLRTKSLGYADYQQVVTINDPNETVNLRIVFGGADEVFDLEAFEVVGAVSATVKALNIERSAADLREVIASDIFGQFVDRNPAEALQRVAGVTVEDDQGEGAFVIIRGASPELSNVQIDGIELATPQPDGRRVNLNSITVDQLERIEVSKTWLPSQKGNTIGGTVNLVTRSALDRGERFASAEVAYSDYQISDEDSFRGQVTFGDTIDSEDWKWLGEKAIGIQLSASQSEDNRGSETLSFGYNLDASYPFGGDPLYGYTLIDNRWRDYTIKRERTAVSGKFELRFNDQHEVFVSASYNKFDDDEVQQFFRRYASTGNDFSWDGDEFLTVQNATNLGYDLTSPEIIARLGAPPTSTTRRLTYTESIELGQLAYDPETKRFTFGSWTGGFSRNFDNEITNDELLTYQIGGTHQLGDGVEVDWAAYNSTADRDTARLTFGFGGPGGIMNSVFDDSGYPRIDPTEFLELSLNPAQYDKVEPASSSSGASTLFSQSYSLSEDERSGFRADISINAGWFGLQGESKLGIAQDGRSKTFSRDYATTQILTGAFSDDLYRNNRITLEDVPFYGGISTAFVDNFGESFQFGPLLDTQGLRDFVSDPSQFGVTIADSVEPGVLSNEFFNRLISNYTSTEDILGLYWQQTLFWKQWSLIFGLRWEETESSFTNLAILTRDETTGQFIRPSFWRFFAEDQYSKTVTTRRRYDNWLPAVHLRRDLGENSIIRASVTETIARPRFDQIDAREIPTLSGSNFGTTLQLPNFGSINPMESTNYDLSFERYLDPVGKFEVSVFYKDLKGPVYNERRLAVGPDDETRPYAYRYDSRNANRDGVDDPRLINSSPWTFNRDTNAGDAELYGWEFSFSSRLDRWLPDILSGFSLEGNYSEFESEVQLLSEERISPRNALGEVIEVDPTVPLFKQPEKTANLSLLFERWGIFARVSYNLRGRYLNSVFTGDDVGNLLRIEDSPSAMDQYVDETERFDFTMRYNITPWLQIFVEAINFTNEPQVIYLGDPIRPSSVRFTDPIYTVGIKMAL